MTTAGAEQAPEQAVEQAWPVLIAGAGLAGLSAAVFLGQHGVRSLVAERHPGLSTQPKARGQAPPTMEALRAARVADRFGAGQLERALRVVPCRQRRS